MGKIQEKQMKNIEEINKASVKKILTKKKIPEFFAGDTIKLALELLKGKEKEFSISRVFVLQKKIEI